MPTKDELEAANAELNTEVTTLTTEVTELKDRLKELEAEKEEHLSSSSELSSEIRRLKEEKEVLERLNATLEEDKNNLTAALEGVGEDAVDTLSAAVSQLNGRQYDDPFFHQVVSTTLFALLANPGGASRLVDHIDSYLDRAEEVVYHIYQRFAAYQGPSEALVEKLARKYAPPVKEEEKPREPGQG